MKPLSNTGNDAGHNADTAARLAALGLAVPELLIPKAGVDLSKWAVIACDQFVQDRDYWEQVRAVSSGAVPAGDAPSSLNLIYPEVYLEDPDRAERIAAIHRAMGQYLAEGLFFSFCAPVYVERDTPFHSGRQGLVIALDLEYYDWKPGSTPLIRPTEGTVAERIPPRMEIRRNAPLETPHILILVDDEENALLPALACRAKDPERPGGGKPLYDTELMFNSGRVRGWKLDGETDGEFLAAALERLARRMGRNGVEMAPPAGAAPPVGAASLETFLYAVGDGNHSLATAKAVWEEYKITARRKSALQNDPAIMNHPARWALVEVENLYDPALTFEPIHRILFGVSAEEVQRLLSTLPGYVCRRINAGRGSEADIVFRDGVFKDAVSKDGRELAALTGDERCGQLRFGIASGADCFLIEADPVPLAVDVLQPLLDRFLEEHPGAGIDYIHGTDELFRLAGTAEKSAGDNGNKRPITGILLPPFRKQGLFETIARRGPLPRKSFSMGEACEKRFYLECRKLG